MADKDVKVRVDVSATGNLAQVLNVGAGAAEKLKQNIQTVSSMMAKMATGSESGAGKMAAGFAAASAQWKASLPTATALATPAETAAAAAAAQRELEQVSRKLTIAFAGMVGAVAAAGGGAFETFTGSLKLAAGELGIAFIPVITLLSGWLQDLARTIRTVNDATGGWAGKIIGGALVLGVMFAATVKAATALEFLAGAATGAAARQGLAGAGGAAAGAGASGLAGRLGLAGVGVAASQLVGGAVGGTAGGYLGSVGTGASIGAAAGSFIPVIGTAIGAAIGAIGGGVYEFLRWKSAQQPTAFTTGFQGQSMELGGVGAIAQHEAIRDPLQQQQFDQQMRAMERLINSLDRAAGSFGAGTPGGAGPAWGVNG